MKALQLTSKVQLLANPLPSHCRCNGRNGKGHSRLLRYTRAEKSPGSQQQASAPSQDQAQDPAEALLEEIAREDEQAAEIINGKPPVFDLFPQPPRRLTAREQKQRAFKLSRRPLRQYQDADRVHAHRRKQAGSGRHSVAAHLPAVELTPVDLRPTPPLPPICNLPRTSVADREAALKRVSSVSEHYKPLESGEGIGTYARKVAAAGLGPLPNPRLVVEYHPMVSKARMDRNVAAGYDPDAEWGSDSILAGEDMTDLGGDAIDEGEQELQKDGGAERWPSRSAATEEADTGGIPEPTLEDTDEVGWGEDFVDDDEETLQDEFGRVLDETIEQHLGEDPTPEDTEGFGVWDGRDEEDVLGSSKGRSQATRQTSGSADDAEGVEDLDAMIMQWQEVSRIRRTEGQ